MAECIRSDRALIAKPWLKSKVGPPNSDGHNAKARAPIGSFGTGKGQRPHFGCGLRTSQCGSGRGLSRVVAVTRPTYRPWSAAPAAWRSSPPCGGRVVLGEQVRRWAGTPQLYPVFTCCRMSEIGAHHAGWLLLHELFHDRAVTKRCLIVPRDRVTMIIRSRSR